jgi:hypothetical protein
LRRYATLSARTVITLEGPIRLTHCGYRCPNPDCTTRQRSYRSAAADALALPGFTFGLDVIALVGHLRLAQHHTYDQLHQAIKEQLQPLGVTISRREVLYLFDAYCVLLRAAEQIAHDTDWHAQVRANGGLIISIDGIQPDKGNETIYLVRDVITGRLLAAENVQSSETATIQALLQPIRDLDLPVLGAISDAQKSLLQAIEALWPGIPHQVCQFHYLREASRPMYEVDRRVRKQLRKALQQDVREVRKQIARQQALDVAEASRAEELTAEQRTSEQTKAELVIVDDYALAIQTALNLDGLQPFAYAALAADEALSEIAASLERVAKGGAPAAEVRPN